MTPTAATPDAATAIDVSGLTRRYGAITAVDGLSFTVPRGQVVTVLGPNGAGKTTTLETLEGFAAPDAGSVRVLGLDPWRQSGALRPKIGVMLQAGGAHLSARAGEALSLVARCSANPLDTGWLLEVLGLGEVVGVPVRRLSGGQVQRLSLAMALVGRPELLILDEPTAGMDPQVRHLVWDLIRAARRDGMTVLLTTHLLDEAELLSDRILIIDHGRLLADGSPAELVAGSAPELTFAARPGLDLIELAGLLPADVTTAEPSPGHYRLTGQGISPDVLATVTAFCARNGVMPQRMHTGARSLDEVYLQLTGSQVRS
ncbi:ABC transporter ATP-binding protein [Nakamurella lactea]|uniref:ABC transporter ATP-binding protein n=1 Tax=Nakamurella lactea TaxID=459515 RepID=UPI0004238BB4|nr:ABC transporter ATP-binding protein [Nakamurella lactea]